MRITTFALIFSLASIASAHAYDCTARAAQDQAAMIDTYILSLNDILDAQQIKHHDLCITENNLFLHVAALQLETDEGECLASIRTQLLDATNALSNAVSASCNPENTDFTSIYTAIDHADLLSMTLRRMN